MKIKSILVSQPAPKLESSPYSDLADKHKVKIDFRAFIHVEGESASDVRRQKVDLSQYPSIILTSRNAIDHYFRVAEEMRYKVPDTTKYFCLSEAVANYLQKYIVYRKRKIYVGERTIDDVIGLMKKFSKEKFLLPTSDVLNPVYEKALNDSGYDWTRVIMYRTVCSDLSDLKEVNYDMLVFFSPSGIESLFKNFPDFKQNDTKIAVYGSNTIKAAQDAGLKIDLEAPTEKFRSMTMALQSYIEKCE